MRAASRSSTAATGSARRMWRHGPRSDERCLQVCMRRITSAVVLGILYGALIGDAQTPARDRPLPRRGTSSIRGRVLTAATEIPLRNVRVQATSDLGAYRLGGLPEGAFLVSVNLVPAVDYRGEPPPPPVAVTTTISGRPTTMILGRKPDGTRTYYPGVLDRAQAQPITIAAGEDRTP